ncbi:MAG TPA: GTPase HflX [Gammaproteobacteria bacterium]|nr:GTPase HflX [Gammaproteobacteria bacterium]
MFERPQSGERAILVHLDLQSEGQREELQEFEELARSAGAAVVDIVGGSRERPDPRFFAGSGKADEIQCRVQEHQADLVLFNHTLSPSQERNLEAKLKCRVLDRTGLILDIFAQRARSFEGKLQVELAQLKHLSTRLVRGWTHLERQKGGIGLRGPGETQLETDRRLIGGRIRQLKKKLEKHTEQRHLGSRARRRALVPAVSLVGYTNAGKSTLFNSLTGAEVYVADQLFATLDPTLRRLYLKGVGHVVLADTVGFIRHLPHDLVEAFRSTLEETCEADVLLHVIDASDPERNMYIDQVNEVLGQIGADNTPQIKVYNKIDLTEIEARIDRNDEGVPVRVWVSAKTGAGIDLLQQAVSEFLLQEKVHGWIMLRPDQGHIRAALYETGAISTEQTGPEGASWLEILMSGRDFAKIQKKFSVELEIKSLELRDESGTHTMSASIA